MKNGKEYAFIFKGSINPVALIRAQSPLGSIIITGMIYKSGMYHVTLHANNDRVIESYLKDCHTHEVEFEKIDIDMPQYGAVYMYKAKK